MDKIPTRSSLEPMLRSQIREKMSGPEISWYGESILGCGLWPGLDCGKKGSGLITSNFWGPFFHFFRVKIFFKFFWKNLSVRTKKLHWKKVRKIFLFSEKSHFFRTKNATVGTLRLGTDYCWLYCGSYPLVRHKTHGESNPLLHSYLNLFIF